MYSFLLRLAQVSFTTYTSNPSFINATAVWSTQMWVSIPPIAICLIPAFLSSLIFWANEGSCKAEKDAFSVIKVCSLKASCNVGTVCPKPFGYCSVTTTGIPNICAAFATLVMFWATSSPYFDACTSLSWISMITKALSSIFNIF